MESDARVRDLLEEALNSERTPEEVCKDEPEHLVEVRRRWVRIQSLAGDLERAFPSSDMSRGVRDLFEEPTVLPDIPGYALESVIGHGGMGVVYKARHLGLGRDVAIKMPRAGDGASARDFASLVREARSIAALKHPHIVQVHDVGEHNGLPYFTMELMDGGSLSLRLAGQPQPAMKSAEWVSVLAHAVHAAHERGIVHRDLKPGNILIGSDGTLRITDFGLARRVVGAPGESEMTIGAVHAGTPSYMPPEQALGTAEALKPASDIWSLGAILYEMLTGRPPFRGESPAETERQVIGDEPVAPSRLNPRTPRDLQTICLKCLQKTPERRYATALELAEDLERFRRGEPIRARPVGRVERSIKWARRRPAQAALVGAAVFVIAMGFVAGLWYQSVVSTRRAELAVRESESRGAVRFAIDRALAAIASEEWGEAERALAHAKERTAEAHSLALDAEIESLSSAIRLARALEETRQSRMAPLSGQVDSYQVFNGYNTQFAEAGFRILRDPQGCAASIRSSPIRAQLLAALDDWASAAYDVKSGNECDQLLAIAREADPGSPWRERFRTRAVWTDHEALVALAGEAAQKWNAADGPELHQIGLLGIRLNQAGDADTGAELLRAVLVRRPSDFWMNWELGAGRMRAGRFQEAVAPLRAAVAIRPDNSAAWGLLGGVLCKSGSPDEGIPMLHRALEMAPEAWMIRRNLVIVLCDSGRWAEAEAECATWPSPDQWYLEARALTIQHLIDTRRYDEALAKARELYRLDPDNLDVLGTTGICLMNLGRLDEADEALRETTTRNPTNGMARAWFGRCLFREGRIDEAITENLAALARGVHPNILRPPVGELLLACSRLSEAFDTFEQLTRANPSRIDGWTGLARVQMGRRQFKEARAHLDRASSIAGSPEERRLLPSLIGLHASITHLAEQDEGLLLAEGVSGDAVSLRDAAVWNWRCSGNPRLAVRQFEAAFAADPRLLSDPVQRVRFDAASAAFAAAGAPASPHDELSSEETARLRARALDWLSTERDALAARGANADGPARVAVAGEFRAWVTDPAILAAFGRDALDRIPEADRERSRALWSDIKQRAAADDPTELISRAQVSAALCDWTRASELYEEAFVLEPDQYGDYWFERAATRLLAGDLEGYRETCLAMMDAVETSSKIRAYHVARTCTLGPLHPAALSRAEKIGVAEIARSASSSWAMTESAAIMFRGSPEQNAGAIGLFKKSIDTDPRPGMAVVNWLWLALANDRAGSPAEARRWLLKAETWLDRFGGEQPPPGGPAAIHLHNWLEAHILRLEAAAALERRKDAGE